MTQTLEQLREENASNWRLIARAVALLHAAFGALEALLEEGSEEVREAMEAVRSLA